MTKPLEGGIAVVAGATRGEGPGITSALSEAVATVHCTGAQRPRQPHLRALGRNSTRRPIQVWTASKTTPILPVPRIASSG